MERLMRLHDDVMRVLTVKVDSHDDGPSVQMQKRDERDSRDRDRGDRPPRDRDDRPRDRDDRPREGGFSRDRR
jgi:small subunit ribosomal protein S6